MKIGQYLIRAIQETGTRHVFGIQGDYVLNFYEQLCKSQLKVINTCTEQGAGFAAPARRPLVLAGDGSFQMSAMELSASVRYGLNPIVIILNNGGYGTFRSIVDR